jgi:hypothetical protein
MNVCSLRCPACNTHAPYYHLWPARLYNISLHYTINGIIVENVTKHKMGVLILSTTIFYLRGNETDIMNVYWSSCEVPVIVRF